MERKPDQHPTMADIVAEAKVDIARAARERAAAEQARGPRRQWVEDRLFTISEDDLTAEQALHLAEESRLIVFDVCGCGGGCGYEVWEGSDVSEIVRAGKPIVQDGYLGRIEDEHGRTGVLVEQRVRWGALR